MGGRTLKLAFSLALVALGLAAGVAIGGVGPNPANHPRLIDKPIEGYRYDHARKCRKRTPSGTKALIGWLERHTSGTSWGAYRCEKLSGRNYSLHAEGRAIDWAMDAANGRQKREAMKLIKKKLLGKDSRGNAHALARRMGVQGLIFNCRAWWSGMDSLGRYSYCFNGKGRKKKGLDRTAAHKDHIHIELNKPGSRKKTSFWRSGLR